MNDLGLVLTQITLGQILNYGFLFLIIIFIFIIFKVSTNKNLKFSWIDLISNPDGSASLTRVLQFTAGITGTWVIIQSTIGKWLTVELFATYLVAMGISEGFGKWLQTKKDIENKE